MAKTKKTQPEPAVFLVAPTERHRAIQELVGEHGQTSMLPERYGVDIAWRAHGDWWGIQRKEIGDFLASVQDGRLAREIAQMQQLKGAWLALEGKQQFTIDGVLQTGKWGKQVSREQFIGMQLSLMARHIHIIHTKDQKDTAYHARVLANWSLKPEHKSFLRRPGPIAQWGNISDRDWALHFLQGFDGLGIEKCRAILDHFERVPFAWDVTEEELLEVPGIGKTLARRLVNAFK